MTPRNIRVKQEATQSGLDYTNLSRISYLIADKNSFTRSLLNQTLRNFSATDVRETADFAIAMNMIRERPPEIVFLNLGADQIDGQNFLKALRRFTDETSYIPAITLSQFACAEEISIAVALGADSCIAIPFSVATIEAHLIKILKDGKRR